MFKLKKKQTFTVKKTIRQTLIVGRIPLLTLKDRAPIRTLLDRGGGALRAPPPSISETIIDRDLKIFLVGHVYI